MKVTDAQFDHAINLLNTAKKKTDAGSQIYLKGCVNFIIKMKPDNIEVE